MKIARSLRKSIITLMNCKTDAAAKKCAERISTIIDQIEEEYHQQETVIALYEIALEEQRKDAIH